MSRARLEPPGLAALKPIHENATAPGWIMRKTRCCHGPCGENAPLVASEGARGSQDVVATAGDAAQFSANDYPKKRSGAKADEKAE